MKIIQIKNRPLRFLAGFGVIIGMIAVGGTVLAALLYGLGRLVQLVAEPIYARAYPNLYAAEGITLSAVFLWGYLVLVGILLFGLICLGAKELGEKLFDP